MKNILIPLFLLKSIFVIGQTPYIVDTSPNGNVSSGPPITYQAFALRIGIGGYNISATGQVDFKAAQYLNVKPGFFAGNLTGAGYAHLQIDPNLIDVVSFHPSGFAGIPQYDRFELGIKLPLVIQQQVDAFLAPNNLGNTAVGINPYDPDRVRVECEFMHISSLTTMVRHGFYFLDYVRSGQPERWVEQPTNYKFRVRFAPPSQGSYSAVIKVYLNNSTNPSYVSSPFGLHVVFSPNEGTLKLTSSPQFPDVQKFQYERTGNIFYAIGRNVPGAATDANNPQPFANPMGGWHEFMSSPKTHDDHRMVINDLASNGANYVRIRLDNSSVPVEAQDKTAPPLPQLSLANCINNYNHNQMFMWEMDKTLALCEEKEVKIMLNILFDADFTVAPNINADGLQWVRNPYSILLGNNLAGRNSFFDVGANTNNVINIFKKRLYYIEARWGYSPNIGLWELINETENMGSELHPNWDTFGFKSLVQGWLCEMTTYLHTFYPQHPVTTGGVQSAAREFGYGPDAVNNNLTCLDVYSENIYYNEWEKSLGQYAADWNYWFRLPLELFSNNWSTPTKMRPFIWGEVGLHVHFDQNWGNVVLTSPSTFHTANWTSIFTNNLGIGLQWHKWDYSPAPGVVAPNPFHTQYNAIKMFTSKIDFNQRLLSDRNEAPAGYRTGSYNNSNPIPAQVNEGYYSNILTYWLKTTNKETVYGWSRNTCHNWVTDAYPNLTPAAKDSIEKYLNAQSIGHPSYTIYGFSNSILVQGLLPNAKYNVFIYDTWDPSGSLLEIKQGVQTDWSGKLRFGRDMPPMPAAPYYPDYAFIAKKCTDDACTLPEEFPPGKAAVNVGNIEGQKEPDKIFPIPASSSLYLHLSSHEWKNPKIYIIDALGKEIEKELNKDHTVDTKEFANGFYTLKIKDEIHEKIFKVVIQH